MKSAKPARPELAQLESLEPRLMLSATKEAIWIEGEDTTSTTFNRNSWYSGVNPYMLSPGPQGDWLAHYTGGNAWAESAWAMYNMEVQEGGEFYWWIRVNPFTSSSAGARYSYRIRPAGGTWSPQTFIDTSDAQNDMVPISYALDIRFIGWAFVDTVDLQPGQYQIEIRMDDNNNQWNQFAGGVDAMSFTNWAWAPSGVVPPDVNAPAAGPNDWFNVMMGPDDFSGESIIDMSHLLDDTAGEHGWLGRNLDDFVFEDGTGVKFWGVNSHPASDSVEIMQRQARFYAKHGINMTRTHSVEGWLGSMLGTPNNRSFDADRLDHFDRWFAICKENGIYTTWSVFYHHKILPDQRVSVGGTVPDALYNELPSNKDTYGLATFIEEYQDSQWAYVQTLLNHVNPYTGLAYKDDPALAIVETRNEDSVFFSNPLSADLVNGTTRPQHTLRLRTMWHQWVRDNYANDTELAAAWGTAKLANDSVNANPSTQPMRMYAGYELSTLYLGPNGNKRAGDYIKFLAQMQRDDYLQYKSRVQSTGFGGIIVSTAWRAGGAFADPANTWTDDAMDAITRHDYFGGGAGGHGITTGAVNNDSMLWYPGGGTLDMGMYQVEDKPFITTEWTSKPPNQWKAEAAPLMAFYGMGLQGWDASYHFAGSRSYMGSGWPSLNSYVTETPHYIGQFPALSFAIYNNHFAEGDIVAARRVETEDLFLGIDVLRQDFTGGGWDDKEPVGDLNTPLNTLAMGRVTFKAADGIGHSFAANWAQYEDIVGKYVTSNTGQLKWSYGAKDYILAQSNKTQGVIGFAGPGTYDLPGSVIMMNTDFASLILTPLDNRPLDQSEHILVTAMGQDRQYNSQYSSDGYQLTSVGSAPLQMKPVNAMIFLKGAPILEARPVDFYGVPMDQTMPILSGQGITIDGTYQTYYYEIKRAPSANLPGDANGDGVVDDRDLNIVLGNWGSSSATWSDGDFDANGVVDDRDLNVLLGAWGNTAASDGGDEPVLAAAPTEPVLAAAEISQPVLTAEPTLALAARSLALQARSAKMLTRGIAVSNVATLAAAEAAANANVDTEAIDLLAGESLALL